MSDSIVATYANAGARELGTGLKDAVRGLWLLASRGLALYLWAMGAFFVFGFGWAFDAIIALVFVVLYLPASIVLIGAISHDDMEGEE